MSNGEADGGGGLGRGISNNGRGLSCGYLVRVWCGLIF